ncbi:MAG: manganese efflux pump MntP family protein [Candidatus Cloacimonadales bacterium]
MSFWTIVIIAIGLAMDAFAVSISNSCSLQRMKLGAAVNMSLFFGVFQGVMPIIGWFAGSTIKDQIEAIDHWIAFVLLVAIGLKMIYEAFQMNEEEDRCSLSLKVLVMLSIATSIDALAVGISLSCLQIDIIFPALMIGIITFGFSLFGVYLGKKFGHLFESKIEVLGGVILIAIGVKILLEHTLLA